MPEKLTEIVLEIGGEGGGYIIHTMNTSDGRLFRLTSDSISVDTDGEEEWLSNQQGCSSSLDEMFLELNPVWYKLYPMSAHPDFADLIWDHYVVACQQSGEPPGRIISIWSRLLLGRSFSTLRDAIAYSSET
jgi:hypothetical protein